MSTAMRDFYKAIGELNVCWTEDRSDTVKSYFDNLTEEEQNFVWACCKAEVHDAIS